MPSDIPELIEPVFIKIKQLDKPATVYSSGVSGKREIMNAPVLGSEITLPAQIVFGDGDQKPNFSQLGTDEQSKGYLVLRYVDVTSAAVVLQKGDKITKLGQLDVEYYLLHTQGDPAAHFSSIGGFTLFRMFFSDRKPKG